MIEEFNLEQIVVPLQEWFRENARTMPWRDNPTPYNVWISEVMLQQTRVEAVRSYFDRFVKELPDVKALAECEEERYLKLWEGLGYYSRVRNLHEAALQVMENHNGTLPANYKQLLNLKGIGNYTAGAISSIAYGLKEPAVDGNVFRVLTRLSADDTDIMMPAFRTKIEVLLRELMNHSPELSPSVFNQAIMELGAIVCIPNGEPKCEQCPLAFCCKARELKRQTDFPVKKKQKARRIEKRTVLIIRETDNVLVQKRPSKGLLAGLYEFPNYPGELSYEEIVNKVKEFGLTPLRVTELEDATHIFSHVEWHMKGYRIVVEEDEITKGMLVDAETVVEQYAIPSAFRAFTKGL